MEPGFATGVFYWKATGWKLQERKEFSTGKTQGKLQERVFNGKNSALPGLKEV